MNDPAPNHHPTPSSPNLGNASPSSSPIRRFVDAAEPIAIVGFDFRFPGGCDSEDKFWEMLTSGRVNVPTVPADRFNASAFSFPFQSNQVSFLRNMRENSDGFKSRTVLGGHFIGNVSRFDASFFGITEAEAMAIDPQQRCLLETTYRALESGRFSI
jgi:acyl transferase domain-containing protein